MLSNKKARATKRSQLVRRKKVAKVKRRIKTRSLPRLLQLMPLKLPSRRRLFPFHRRRLLLLLLQSLLFQSLLQNLLVFLQTFLLNKNKRLKI